MITKGKQ